LRKSEPNTLGSALKKAGAERSLFLISSPRRPRQESQCLVRGVVA
jgi:hypothetical protein